MSLRQAASLLTTLAVALGLAPVGRSAEAAPGKTTATAAEKDGAAIAETAAKRFKEGDFDLAARLFLRAVELTLRPAQLFNAGRALEQAGRAQEAMAAFDRYIAVETDAAGREEARARVQRLRETATPPPPGATTGPVATEPRPVAAETPKTLEPHPLNVRATEPSPRPLYRPVPKPSTSSNSAMRTAGWAVMGTGAAAALAGTAVWALATRDDSTLQRQVNQVDTSGRVTGISQVTAFSHADAIASQKTIGVVVLGAGVACVAVGLAVALSAPRDAESHGYWLAPTPMGVALGGRF